MSCVHERVFVCAFQYTHKYVCYFMILHATGGRVMTAKSRAKVGSVVAWHTPTSTGIINFQRTLWQDGQHGKGVVWGCDTIKAFADFYEDFGSKATPGRQDTVNFHGVYELVPEIF